MSAKAESATLGPQRFYPFKRGDASGYIAHPDR
jgi:hypothetical protein